MFLLRLAVSLFIVITMTLIDHFASAQGGD